MLFEIDICSFYLQKVHKVVNICVFHEFYINPPNALIQTKGVSSEIKDHSNHRTTLVTHIYNKAINYLANQLGWCQWRSQPSDTSWSATQSFCTTMGERRRWTGFTTSPLNVPLFFAIFNAGVESVDLFFVRPEFDRVRPLHVQS